MLIYSYISTFSTTSTLRLPVYILSAVDAYQKAYGTAKRVMLMLQSVLMYYDHCKASINIINDGADDDNNY